MRQGDPAPTFRTSLDAMLRRFPGPLEARQNLVHEAR